MIVTIYYCGFGQEYFREAIIAALSVRCIGGFDGQIVIFCDQNYGYSWLESYGYPAPKVTIIPLGEKAPKDAAVFRLAALDYLEYSNESILLYLDADILCIHPIDWQALLSNCDLNLVNAYGYPHRTQVAPSMAGSVTDDPNILSQKAFCSGLLLFRPLQPIRQAFIEIQQRYAAQAAINSCWEQPMLCYILLKRQLVSINLDQFVNELRNYEADKPQAFFNHLCGFRHLQERHTVMLRLLNIYQGEQTRCPPLG
jgi:hypothetical protein